MTTTAEYTEGVCHDGAAILKDGVMLTISEVLSDLNRLAEKEAVIAERDAEIARLETWPEWATKIYKFMRKLGYYEGSSDDIHLPDDLEEWFDEYVRSELSRVSARLAEAEKDAARYRWLRDGSRTGRSNRWPHITQYPHQPEIDKIKPPQIVRDGHFRGEFLDEAIDAGMGSAPPEQLLTEHARRAFLNPETEVTK